MKKGSSAVAQQSAKGAASPHALRFLRIVRLRPDKSAEEADNIERAKEIWDSQARQVPIIFLRGE